MNPRENILFLLMAILILAVIICIFLVFRKRKKWAIALTIVLVIGYIGYYIYYPFLKVNTHAERYEQVIDYLAKNYPNKQFTISPKHYEEGYRVGDFKVNDVVSPTIGVSLRVDEEGQVTQRGTWNKDDYPTQQELWRETNFIYEEIYGENYSLEKEIPKITKQDEWIDGELTVFALTIEDLPAIAIYNYSSGGYGFLELQQGEREGFIFIEMDGYVFTYIDESYQGEEITIRLKNGEEYSLNTDENKGHLIVKK